MTNASILCWVIYQDHAHNMCGSDFIRIHNAVSEYLYFHCRLVGKFPHINNHQDDIYCHLLERKNLVSKYNNAKGEHRELWCCCFTGQYTQNQRISLHITGLLR